MIIFILLSLHSSLYACYFLRTDLLPTRIRDVDVISGMSSHFLFSILTVSTLRVVSGWNYRVFYTIHVLIFLIRFVDELLRRHNTRTFCASVAPVPNTNLVQISMPLIQWEETWAFGLGEHVVISRPPLGASVSWNSALNARYRTSPFTIASLPERDRRLVLISRTRRGNTKRLSDIARLLLLDADTRVPPYIALTAEGPYPGDLATADLRKFSRVLIVAGGVGATFGFPIFRSMSYDSVNGRAVGGKIQRLQFVWAVREPAEAAWAFSEEFMESERRRVWETGHKVELYITGRARGDGEGADADAALLGDIELAEEGEPIWDEDLLRSYGDTSVVRHGRPCLKEIVREQLSSNSDDSLALLVCGPTGMVSELRHQAGNWKNRGRHVYWHAEQFSNQYLWRSIPEIYGFSFCCIDSDRRSCYIQSPAPCPMKNAWSKRERHCTCI
ncbi:hypothetical protein HBI56_193770 [Parastagonospora nodorum]|nr:hypothetical protein HBH53_190060 [Parastagonospora nodorum]KAH3993133.1 hypothetical protein HBI10_207160 [Parastagonospora nodorum]KAH4010903.1 hypothetical protein HBI13_204300 [Parastagonospora nodorum]KAH4019214.1 hypothetical protein HBI09_186460 [Parastagonospora nodorum]KAH4062106.1 hypothetical protein HBH50_209610 [Parastagonospora nodorum]